MAGCLGRAPARRVSPVLPATSMARTASLANRRGRRLGYPVWMATRLAAASLVSGGTLTLNHATVAGNQAVDPPANSSRAGGGAYQSGAGAVVAGSSIFGGNSAK